MFAVGAVAPHLSFNLLNAFKILIALVWFIQNVILLILKTNTAETVFTAKAQLAILAVGGGTDVTAEVTVVGVEATTNVA